MTHQQQQDVQKTLETHGVAEGLARDIARIGSVPGMADIAVDALTAAGFAVKNLTFKGGVSGPLVAGDVVELPKDIRVGQDAVVRRAIVTGVETGPDGRLAVALEPVRAGACSRAECAQRFNLGHLACRHGRLEAESLISVALQLVPLVDALSETVKSYGQLSLPADIARALLALTAAANVDPNLQLPARPEPLVVQP